MVALGRVLVIAGVVLLLLGLFLTYSGVFSFLKLGRLPGDIRIQRGTFSFYFPLATCILLSIVISLILCLFRK